jgi:hypothetical protein
MTGAVRCRSVPVGFGGIWRERNVLIGFGGFGVNVSSPAALEVFGMHGDLRLCLIFALASSPAYSYWGYRPKSSAAVFTVWTIAS